MKIFLPIIALAGLLSVSAVLAVSEKPEDIVGCPLKWSELQKGEPVLLCDPDAAEEAKRKFALAGIIIDSPAKAVWDVVMDKEAATDYVKTLKRAEVLEKGVEGGLDYEVVEQDVKLGLFPKTFTYCVKSKLQPYQRIDFRRTSGDLKDIQGFWRFVPVDEGDRTLLVYQLEIDPGMLIPGPVVRNSLKKSLPDALRGVRDEVAKSSRVSMR